MQMIKSRSSKSGPSKRKSIVPPPIKIKTVEMKLEPHYSSLQRWKKSALEESKWEEFRQHYKVDPAKKPLDVEIYLLSGYIGDVFTTINRLIEESQTTLKQKGAEFHRNGKAAKKFPAHYKVDPTKKPLDVEIYLLSGNIGDVFTTINRLIEESQTALKEKGAEFRFTGKAAKKFPASVYQYLEDSETPEYIRYTAMGSEIGNGVFLDETKRRHALAVLRRKLPKLRERISVEDREEYGFPANSIEFAFKRDSRLFENVEAIKTDSTKNLSEVTQE
uniref:Uncharacterized protein n=1 Tax=Panagrolaimus sp. PS1159 TaxID=55785 RepID=A0AC35GFT1_9BILA